MVRRVLVALSAVMAAFVLAAAQMAYAEAYDAVALGSSASGEAVGLGAPAPEDGLLAAQSATFDELNGDDMRLGQPGRGDCVVTSCAMMLRRAERLLGWDWGAVTVESVRPDATGSSWGKEVYLEFWHDGLFVECMADGIKDCGDSTKAETLRRELDWHPEGIVLYAEEWDDDDQYWRTHAVLLTDYVGDTFYCVDPNSPDRRKPIEESYLVRISTAYQIWRITNQSIPAPVKPVKAPTWDYGGDAWLETGWYNIRLAADTNKYLEIGGAYTGDGGNVQIWGYSWLGVRDHIRFHLNRLDDGSYAIDTFAGKVLDVAGGSTGNGANVQQCGWNGSDAQKWYIQSCGNGVYALQSKCSGKYLDLEGGGTMNGNNVSQWEYGNNNNQRWVITPCDLYGASTSVPEGWWYIRSSIDPGYAMNIAAASTEDGANLQLWKLNKTTDQKFRFVRTSSDESYRIEAQCSGKVLDVAGESRADGANVQQYSWWDTDCQKWYVQDAGDGKVAIQSRLSGYYLDLMWGNARDGQNIWQHSVEGVDTPRFWYLTPADEGTPIQVEDGNYEIVSDTAEAGVVTGSPDDEFTFVSDAVGSDYQAFRLSTVGGKTRLLNVGRSACMDVYAASLREGARVNLVGDTGTPQQDWHVEDAGNGMVSLRNDYTNFYLDVKGGIGTSGTPLQMYRGNGSAAQRYHLRRLTLADAAVDAIPDQFPTGSAVEPPLTVRFAGRVLERGRDYAVEWRDNVSSGEAVAVLTGAGNFAGALETRFRIKELSKPGWVTLPSGEKAYAKDGKLVTGWMDLDSSKYWFGADGAMATGWTDVEVSGKTMHYYFNPASGNLVRGTWFEIEGHRYYFRTSGNVAHGWETINDKGVDKKYYFDDDYHMVTGWRDIDTGNGYVAHYYFRPSGSMATGWATIDGRNYWFRPSGNMATGFTTVDDGYKRYFDASGQMLTGWRQIDGRTFYFRIPSGAMQTGKATIDGEPYEFTASGTLKSSSVSDTTIVHFDAGEGTCMEPARVVKRGAPIGELPAAKRDHCSFDGWYVEGTDQKVTASTVLPAGQVLTLAARWAVSWVTDIPDDWYSLQASADQTYSLDVAASLMENASEGVAITLWHTNYAIAQMFKLARNGDGSYTVWHVPGKLALGAGPANQYGNPSVVLTSDVSADAAKWYVERGGDGYCSFRNKGNGCYLDVCNNRMEPRAGIQCCGGDGSVAAQKFRMRGSRFALHDRPYSWTEAKAVCERIGGHLATVSTQDEESAIEDLLTGRPSHAEEYKRFYWVGGYKDGGQWRWVTGEPFSYTNWYPGEPSNSGGVEDKVYVYNSKSGVKWNDSADSWETADEYFKMSNLGFIIEWEDEALVGEQSDEAGDFGPKPQDSLVDSGDTSIDQAISVQGEASEATTLGHDGRAVAIGRDEGVTELDSKAERGRAEDDK